MASTQLWDTTMNPESRTLIRMTIDDAAAVEHQVTVLMGDSSEARREWITEHVDMGPEDDGVLSEVTDSKANEEEAAS